MNTCPQCQTPHPDHVRICPNDGTVLTPAATDANIGLTLDGKYRLDSIIGRGGMGSIYKATHLMLDKTVAVKLINPELAPTPDVVRRFQREARAASQLNHPNIAATFDLGQTSNGTLYLAMELISGQSLKDTIRSGGPMAPARIIRILEQVAGALAAAHAHGIVHRDLKPQNIMLTQTPDGGEVAKLLDFGIAKTFEDGATQLTTTGLVLGTPQYMSPEQAAGRPIDGRSDLYSLGIILFEMLVGEVPFNDPSTPAVLVKHLTEPAPPPSARRPDLAIPSALEAVALRCLEKDPGARFQNATEFANALGHAMATPASSAATVIVAPPRETPTQRTAKIATPTVSAPPVAPVQPAAAPPPAPPSPAAAASVPAPASVAKAAASATAAPPASRSLLPGLAVVFVLLLIALGGTYGFMAGWFTGAPAPDSPPSSTPPTASAAPPPASSAPPSSPPSDPPATTSQASSTPPTSAAAAATPPGVRGSGGTAASRGSNRQAGQAGQAEAQAPVQPANPTVAFGCVGEAPVCAALRSAMGPALQSQSIVSVNDAAKADIILHAEAEFTGERREEMFGTTLVTRTYSITLAAQTQVKSQTVPMPAPSSISYDARVGQEKLNADSRVIAMAAAEKIRAFWGKQ